MVSIWPNGKCKYISFIITVTCLSSLNKGVTLPYLTLPKCWALGISYFADFLLPKYLFILRSSFLLRIRRFMRVFSKMEYNQIIQNGGSKMADAFLAINDIIMASPLLLESIYMLANFLFLSNTLLSMYFSLYAYFNWGKFGFCQ